MDISVIIPCYNAERWICATLQSVLAQTLPPAEVIVVDDGSSDGSVALVRQRFPAVRVLEQHNAGAAAARNKGAFAARSAWIAFVDADDIWLPGKLRAQADLLSGAPGACMSSTSWVHWDSQEPEPPDALLAQFGAVPEGAPAYCGPSGWIYCDLLLACQVWTSTVLMQRELFNRLGGFDPSLKIGEDYDLWLRVSRESPVLRVQRPLALYRQHPQSLTRQIPTSNHEGLVVERALLRWGYRGPDGSEADPRQVRRAQARTWHHFGAACLAAGRIGASLAAARKALRKDWQHLGAWKLTAKALMRGLWPTS